MKCINKSMNLCRDNIRGAILGTAIGDALGMPIEGLKPINIYKYYGKITGFRSPNPKCKRIHDLKRGQWTDDTQLMLAIGESIVENGCICYEDIMEKHTEFFEERRGWGQATRNSVLRYLNGARWEECGEPDAAGNGPPMKIAPIGVLYGASSNKYWLASNDKFWLNSVISNVSMMTHKDVRAAIAANIQARFIATGLRQGPLGLLNNMIGIVKESKALEFALGKNQESLCDKIIEAISLTHLSDSEIREKIGIGAFVNQSYAFMCAMLYKYIYNLEDCIINTINQGGDSDTTGAMIGSILGACYGYSSFPRRWRDGIESRERLLNLADNLWRIVK